jgi:hypothetical protein
MTRSVTTRINRQATLPATKMTPSVRRDACRSATTPPR